MKILFCGSRHLHDTERICKFLDSLTTTHAVVGCANGVDAICAAYHFGLGVPVSIHKADWDNFGKSAGPRRNKEMLDKHPDIELVIAFPGGAGTNNMVAQAERRGIKIQRVWE